MTKKLPQGQGKTSSTQGFSKSHTPDVVQLPQGFSLQNASRRVRFDRGLLTPFEIMHMQSVVGNRSTTGILEPRIKLNSISSPFPSVQRRPKTKGSVELSTQGIQLNFNFEPSKAVEARYARVVFSTPIDVTGALTSKKELPFELGGKGTTDGDTELQFSAELYRAEAIETAKSRLAQLAYQDIDSSGWEVEKVEWENETGTDEDSEVEMVSITTGIKFTFKNGQVSIVKASLFKKEGGIDLSGPKFEIGHKINLGKTVLWENAYAKLVGDVNITMKGEVEPNWTVIFAELAKQGGLQVARNFFGAVLRGLIGAGGFIAGGVLTAFTFAANMEAITSNEECRQAARQALEGYIQGYCIALGIDEFGTGGSERWFEAGHADGQKLLAKQIFRIQESPVFKPWEFSAEELRTDIQSGLRPFASKIYSQLKSMNEEKIYKEYVISYYEKRKAAFWRPDYIARNEARWVARGLGLPDSVVPED